jgi:HD-GYP domain-containing protein (c-di-GMP phosphodiesterase class II)
MSGRKLAVFASLSDDTLLELQPLLSDLGLATVTAHDAAEALRLVAKKQPELVVAEADQGSMDGHTLCNRLRQKEPTRGLPIVLVGAEDGREGRLAALRAGADEFFAKPLDQEDVRLRLSALLRRARLQSTGNGTEPAATATPKTAASPPTAGDLGSLGSLYGELVSLVKKALDQVENDEPVVLRCLQEKASLLAPSMEGSEELVALALGEREATDLAAHHVNVAILGLAIARELPLSPGELERFALLGLVHDLGMAKVPASIRYAPRRLTREEFRTVAEHPRHTYEILRQAGPEHHDIAEIAFQEHEREKGQGYPRGLRGDQIHELARIIGVADVYEACTHSRTYRKTFIPYEALQELIEMRGDYFHPRYIKALMNALTVYPLGSYVQLNTGEIGRVQATNRNNLMRPTVELTWNARGKRLASPKAVDLAESPFLFVSKPLYEEQLPPS